MPTADLMREAREWGTAAGPFPNDPEFAEEVAREHREFINWMAAPRTS